MWMPSATSAAMRSIHGLTAATSIGGSGTGRGPGDHCAGSRFIDQKSPLKVSGASPRNARKHARTACTYSRSRGPGGSNSLAYRRSTWARTWVPTPSRKRPPVASASSQATAAVTIGLRGNATATPVARSSCAARAAAAHVR